MSDRPPRPPPLAIGLALLAIGCVDGWEVSVGELAATRNPVIVDDQHGAPAFTLTGDDWTTWGTLGNGYAPEDTSYHYLSSTVGGGDRRGTATWSPTLAQAGTYRIETWFRRTGNRTDDADHLVYDAFGYETHLVIDQTGDGPSGWVPLGDFYCEAGFGGCAVVLDGTDDDASDEANAMRFTLVDTEPPPPPPPCDEDPGEGTHTYGWYAGTVHGDGWEDTSLAVGDEDGAEAHSPNVDDGEELAASDWSVCDPPGEETIDLVEIEVLERVQYDSGQYALVLQLDAGGDAAGTFSHAASAWDTVDITADRPTWSWSDVEHVQARLSLYDHPGGARDSDAWADAFRVRVTFTAAAPSGDDDDSAGGGDDDDADDDTTAADDDGPPGPDHGSYFDQPSCRCGTEGTARGHAPWASRAIAALVALATVARRRGHG